MQMTPVTSSNIDSVGWDDETGEVIVAFKSGAEWGYKATEEVYDSLVAAPSVGAYFASQVKNVYPGRRIS